MRLQVKTESIGKAAELWGKFPDNIFEGLYYDGEGWIYDKDADDSYKHIFRLAKVDELKKYSFITEGQEVEPSIDATFFYNIVLPDDVEVSIVG